jgi:hypothetical protein
MSSVWARDGSLVIAEKFQMFPNSTRGGGRVRIQEKGFVAEIGLCCVVFAFFRPFLVLLCIIWYRFVPFG